MKVELEDIAFQLRKAERELRIAVSLAGKYRGKRITDGMMMRETSRKAAKAMMRISELAWDAEKRASRG